MQNMKQINCSPYHRHTKEKFAKIFRIIALVFTSRHSLTCSVGTFRADSYKEINYSDVFARTGSGQL